MRKLPSSKKYTFLCLAHLYINFIHVDFACTCTCTFIVIVIVSQVKKDTDPDQKVCISGVSYTCVHVHCSLYIC